MKIINFYTHTELIQTPETSYRYSNENQDKTINRLKKKLKKKELKEEPEGNGMEDFCFDFLVWALAEAAEIFRVASGAISRFGSQSLNEVSVV